MGEEREVYLGDGLYASYDGWQITLRADRENGPHYVCLKPQVYAVLLAWVKGLASETAANRGDEHG